MISKELSSTECVCVPARAGQKESAVDAVGLVLFCGAFLFSVFAPMVAPIFIVMSFHRGRNAFAFAVLTALWLSVLAYGVETTVVADIDRYTASLPIYRELSLWQAPSARGVYSAEGAYAYNVFAWLFSRMGEDHLLRSGVVFVSYVFPIFVVTDYGHSNGWSTRRILVSTLVLLSVVPFVNQLSYAKSSPAFSLLLYAVYRDIYKSKGKVVNVCIYVLAAMFHSSTLVISVLRLIYGLSRRNLTIGLLSVVALFPTATILYSLIPSGVWNISGLSIIGSALRKFSIYSTYVDEGWALESQTSSLLLGYRYYFAGIAIGYILLRMGNRHLESDILDFGVLWASVCLTVSVVFDVDVFFRFAMPFVALFALLFLSKEIVRWKRLSHLFAAGVMAVGLIVQAAYLASLSDFTAFTTNLMFGGLELFLE